MKLETLEIGTQLKVIKDIYYVGDGRSLDDEFMTKEELFNELTHVCVEGDIYEVVKDEYGTWLECKEGKWTGESNDGWFDVDDMINKGVFEIIK
jgi:hypothetical protein